MQRFLVCSILATTIALPALADVKRIPAAGGEVILPDKVDSSRASPLQRRGAQVTSI